MNDGTSMEELFECLFKTLNTSLQDKVPINDSQRTPNSWKINSNKFDIIPEQELLNRLLQIPSKCTVQLNSITAYEASNIIDRIIIERNLRKKASNLRISEFNRQKELIGIQLEEQLELLKVERECFRRKLFRQEENTKRRLQELMYECLGEMHKAIIRASLRVVHQETNVEEMVRHIQNNFKWKRFLQRIEEETSQQVYVCDITPTLPNSISGPPSHISSYVATSMDYPSSCSQFAPLYDSLIQNEVFNALCSEYKEKILESVHEIRDADMNVEIQRVLEVRYPSVKQVKNESGSMDSISSFCKTYSSIKDLFIRALFPSKQLQRVRRNTYGSSPHDSSNIISSTAETMRSRILPSNVPIQPLYSPMLHLSTSYINWLLPDRIQGIDRVPQIPLNTYIYICLEEMLVQLNQESDGKWRSNFGIETSCSPDEDTQRLHEMNLRWNQLKSLCSTYFDERLLNPEELKNLFPSSLSSSPSHIFEVRDIETRHRVEQRVTKVIPDVLVGTWISNTSVNTRIDTVDPYKSRSSLHFVPATVANLLQSMTSSSLLDSTILGKKYGLEMLPTNLFRNFYVVMHSRMDNTEKNDSIISSLLKPISNEAIEELIATYVVRSNDNTDKNSKELSVLGSATFMSLFPDTLLKNEPTQFCIVKRPSLYSTEGKVKSSMISKREDQVSDTREGRLLEFPVSSLIIQYSLVPSKSSIENSIPLPYSTAKQSKKKREEERRAVLSRLCFWRSCLEPLHRTFSRDSLCVIHGEIKMFLDSSNSSKSAESTKYLPKGASSSTIANLQRNNPLADIEYIKESSTLLMELLSDKLSKTVSSFCRRALLETKDISKQLISSRDYYVVSPVKRNHLSEEKENNSDEEENKLTLSFKDKGSLQDMNIKLHKLRKELKLTQQLLSFEKQSTEEVSKLLEFGVYPTAELSLIRKEFKALEIERSSELKKTSAKNGDKVQHRSDAEYELEFVTRKRNLFKQRRQEEEIQSNSNSIGIPEDKYTENKPTTLKSKETIRIRPNSASSNSSQRQKMSTNHVSPYGLSSLKASKIGKKTRR